MKIRALANGNVIDVDEAQATELIDRGIYERYDGAVADAAPPLSADDPLRLDAPRPTAPRKKAPR